MNPGSHKHYHKDEIYLQNFLNDFCNSDNPFPDENLKFPFEKLYKAFPNEKNTLIDISHGNINYYLNAASNHFNKIFVLKPSDYCAVEAKKSLDSQAGASNSSNTATPAMGSAGPSDKTAKIEVVKFNLSKTNPTDPLVLPQANCLVINSLLDIISRNLDDFGENFGSLAKLLKPGGTLVYCGHFNATYYGIGEEKFEVVKYNESDLTKILTKEGFVDISIEVSKAKAKNDLSDFDTFVFCTAHKKQTP